MTFDDLKAEFIGKSSDSQIFEVEKGSAKRYAVAVDDLNPMYLDEDQARCSRYGTIVAPPGFFGWPVKQPSPRLPQIITEVLAALKEAGFPNILDGGSEFEFFLPVRVGDTLVCTRTIANLSSREGSGGRQMAFLAVNNSYVNQDGNIVANVLQTLIALPPAKAE